MTNNITVDLVTPEKLVSSKQVEMAVIPGSDGDFGILKDHAPLISSIRPGVINLYKSANSNDISDRIFVTGGFAEVTGERCTILATEAIDLSEINKEDIDKRLEKAQDTLDFAKGDDEKIIAEKEVEIAKLLVEIF